MLAFIGVHVTLSGKEHRLFFFRCACVSAFSYLLDSLSMEVLSSFITLTVLKIYKVFIHETHSIPGCTILPWVIWDCKWDWEWFKEEERIENENIVLSFCIVSDKIVRLPAWPWIFSRCWLFLIGMTCFSFSVTL